jgi:hypothetical protein
LKGGSFLSIFKRKKGGVQPGLNWGGVFTLRIPGVHHSLSWPEVIQGGLLSVAVGGAVAPLMMRFFDMPFEVAWAAVFAIIFWCWAGTLLFGEPYNPGWITPSLPLTIVFLGAYTPGIEAIHAMTAITLIVIVIFLFFGITGLGRKFFDLVPTELRAAIIMGAAIAAFNSEFARLALFPKTLPIVWGVLFLLMYSVWYTKIKLQSKSLTLISAFAMILGIFSAAIAGPIFGEITFGTIGWGISVPEFGTLIKTATPMFIGLPPLEMFMAALPLAFAIYIIAFGDLIVGEALLAEAQEARAEDERIILNTNRSHLSSAFRNIGHLLTGGPFIPLHGFIWTGPTVFVFQRYKEKGIDSVYDGGGNFFFLGLILLFFTPVVNIMLPLLPIALSVTLILTGFACAHVAMDLVKTKTGQGYALFVGIILATFGPTWGLIIGVVLYALLIPENLPWKKQLSSIGNDDDNMAS